MPTDCTHANHLSSSEMDAVAAGQAQGAAEAAGLFNRMPIEWLMQVFDQLPNRSLVRVMRTNSDWQMAARYILNDRQRMGFLVNDQGAVVML